MHKLEIPGIDLYRTFNCGQAFRFRPYGGGFLGAAGDKPLYIEQKGDFVQIECPERDLPFWENYFALDCDYQALWALFERDEQLCACKAHAYGIRVLRQPAFETLITFIVSANNHVPRIRVRDVQFDNILQDTLDGVLKPRVIVEIKKEYLHEFR